MEDLIKRLEAVEVGSRDLDLRVFEKFDLVDGERWSDADLEYALTDPDRTINPPRLTQSLDAALALAERVFPSNKIELQKSVAGGYCVFRWYKDGLRGEHSDEVYGSASTPALALCIAILRAKLIDTAQNTR